MSMLTISSMSAVQSTPLWLRSPFGALSPVTHEADTTLPSGVSFMIRPLPSRSFGIPPIIETKIDPDAVSTYALSGASTPSVTVQPAVTRPGIPGVAVVGLAAGAAPSDAAGCPFCGDGLQADSPNPRITTSGNRFTATSQSGHLVIWLFGH